MSELKAFEVKIDGEDLKLLPENTEVSLFRNRSEMDYVDYHIPREGFDDGSEQHTWIFNVDFAHWLGGLALAPRDQRDLKTLERNNGTFKEKTGWNPDTLISDEPTDWELEMYARSIINHALDDDEHLYADLREAFKEEFDDD